MSDKQWQAFDEAVEALEKTILVALNTKLGEATRLYCAHRVLDLLAGMGWMPSYSWFSRELQLDKTPGKRWWEISKKGELPTATRAAVTSAEFLEWRKVNEH